MQETNIIEIQEAPPAAPVALVAEAPSVTLLSYGGKLTRAELAQVPTPAGTATHKPIPHIEVVERLIETLGFRQIGVVRDEYAVSSDGMRMFGVMDLATGFEGCRFALGLRNSHDKTFRLSICCGNQLCGAQHNLTYAQQRFMRRNEVSPPHFGLLTRISST